MSVEANKWTLPEKLFVPPDTVKDQLELVKILVRVEEVLRAARVANVDSLTGLLEFVRLHTLEVPTPTRAAVRRIIMATACRQ